MSLARVFKKQKKKEKEYPFYDVGPSLDLKIGDKVEVGFYVNSQVISTHEMTLTKRHKDLVFLKGSLSLRESKCADARFIRAIKAQPPG